MKVRMIIVAAVSIFCALIAGAFEFQPLGSESISMGGAGVASATGTMAGYYNPALLTESRQTFEFSIGAGAGVRERNLAENIDRLSQIDISATLTRIAEHYPAGGNDPTDIANIKEAQTRLISMSDGNNGLSLMPELALGLQLKHCSIGVYGTSDNSAQAIIDSGRLGLIVNVDGQYYSYDPDTDTYGSALSESEYNAQSLQYALDNNTTYLKLTGLSLVEVPVSYARKFSVPAGKLSLGASAKLMQGLAFAENLDIETESGDIAEDFEDDLTSSTAIGVDAGLLYQPNMMPGVRVGLVAKNLNSPSFKTNSGDYKVDPMYRAGFCLGFFKHKVDLAVDYDISKNKSILGRDVQYFGGGLNFRPTNLFSIRVGAMQNVADDNDEGVILTGGIGFGFKQLSFDISGQMSSKKGTLDNEEIPAYAKANVAIISRW